jgi:hypothetical protein
MQLLAFSLYYLFVNRKCDYDDSQFNNYQFRLIRSYNRIANEG